MENLSWTKSVFFPILHIVWKLQQDRINNNEMGGKGGPQGVQIWFFSMFIFIIYSFIHIIYSYFQNFISMWRMLGIC